MVPPLTYAPILYVLDLILKGKNHSDEKDANREHNNDCCCFAAVWLLQ